MAEEATVNYEQLLFYLNEGREIEFCYKGKEYFIPHYMEGRVLLNEDGDNLNAYTQDSTKFTQITQIDGLTLKDIFQNHLDQVEIQTIF